MCCRESVCRQPHEGGRNQQPVRERYTSVGLEILSS
jgi:hypothetical protein